MSDIFHSSNPFGFSFVVNAFTSNGPTFPITTNLNTTAVSANTSLVVYGRGHPQYGERLQENMLHLLENFSGPTPPVFPVSGQHWFKRLTHIQASGGWWSWNDSTSMWTAFTPNVGTPVVFVHGEYWLNGVVLSRVVNLPTHPLSPTIVTIAYVDAPGVTDPNAESYVPQKTTMVFNGVEWVSSSAVFSSDEEPAGKVGDLWIDSALSVLKYHDGASFVSITAGTLSLSGGTMTGTIDMSGFAIDNLPAIPTAGQAASKEYVDSVAGGVVTLELNDLTDVNLLAIPPTPTAAFLKYTGTEWRAHELLFSDMTNVSATLAEVNHLTGVTSNIQTQLNAKFDKTGGPISGAVSMTNNNINSLADPVFDQDAANRRYVDIQRYVVGTTATSPVSLSTAPTTGSYGTLGGSLEFFDISADNRLSTVEHSSIDTPSASIPAGRIFSARINDRSVLGANQIITTTLSSLLTVVPTATDHQVLVGLLDFISGDTKAVVSALTGTANYEFVSSPDAGVVADITTDTGIPVTTGYHHWRIIVRGDLSTVTLEHSATSPTGPWLAVASHVFALDENNAMRVGLSQLATAAVPVPFVAAIGPTLTITRQYV